MVVARNKWSLVSVNGLVGNIVDLAEKSLPTSPLPENRDDGKALTLSWSMIRVTTLILR